MTVFSGTSILTCSQVARDSRSRIKTAVILGNQYQRLQLSSEAIAISTCCQTSYTHTSNYFIRWHTTHDFVLYILCVAARLIIQEAYTPKAIQKEGTRLMSHVICRCDDLGLMSIYISLEICSLGIIFHRNGVYKCG